MTENEPFSFAGFGKAKPEPTAPMRQMARTTRDIYDVFIAENFTPEQAIDLTKTVITNAQSS